MASSPMVFRAFPPRNYFASFLLSFFYWLFFTLVSKKPQKTRDLQISKNHVHRTCCKKICSCESMNELLQSETTTLEKKHLSWKVANFANFFDLNEDDISQMRPQKLEFKMGYGINLATDWQISLDIEYLTGIQNGIWIYLELIKGTDIYDELNVSYCIQVKNKNGLGLYCDSKFTPLTNMVATALGVKITDLRQFKNTSNLPLTVDGSLIFEILVKMYAPTRTLDVSHHLQMFHIKSTKKQQSDLANMLQENWSCLQADSQTKIVCKDGVEHVVNRGILSARSPVFLVMFQHDTKEAQSGVVNVKDISSMPMKVLLHFLYTGVLQDNWASPGIVEELLYAADKYEQEDLVRFMNETLGMICTERNAGKLVNLARKLNLKMAEEDLFKFINLHATNYDKLESMMRDAIFTDWILPVAEDDVSDDNETSIDLNK